LGDNDLLPFHDILRSGPGLDFGSESPEVFVIQGDIQGNEVFLVSNDDSKVLFNMQPLHKLCRMTVKQQPITLKLSRPIINMSKERVENRTTLIFK
jgi:hypothetical protein